MLHLDAGAGALDYFPCRYGGSKALFRGRKRDLSRAYVAVLGGSASFGKYVVDPYPDLLEQAVGVPVANLAALNAGPDFYLSDPAVLDIAARAGLAVVQVTGAEALTNPFYSVHSRRNDRFLAATPALRALFPRVDFTDIHFTRHLMQVLERSDAVAHSRVVQVLQDTWLRRMQDLLTRLPARRVLLWLAEGPPPEQAVTLEPAPPYIDRTMLTALTPLVSRTVVAIPSPRARAFAPFDMIFPETEASQAACLPGSAAHAEIAAALGPVMAELLSA